jgi:hypothetical protein
VARVPPQAQHGIHPPVTGRRQNNDLTHLGRESGEGEEILLRRRQVREELFQLFC